jgi:hypothetical protein
MTAREMIATEEEIHGQQHEALQGGGLFEDLPVFGGITQPSAESGFEPSHRVRERKDITL